MKCEIETLKKMLVESSVVYLPSEKSFCAVFLDRNVSDDTTTGTGLWCAVTIIHKFWESLQNGFVMLVEKNIF